MPQSRPRKAQEMSADGVDEWNPHSGGQQGMAPRLGRLLRKQDANKQHAKWGQQQKQSKKAGMSHQSPRPVALVIRKHILLGR